MNSRAFLFTALPPDPPPIVGRASVIDGDTIEIHGQRIRLWGIDAPESRQTCTRAGQAYRCGQEAATALSDLVSQNTVACVPRGRPDRYRRIVAICTITTWPVRDVRLTTDLAESQVVSGRALDYPRYSSGAYARAERAAQSGRRGMWAGEFQPPWEWRAR